MIFGVATKSQSEKSTFARLITAVAARYPYTTCINKCFSARHVYIYVLQKDLINEAELDDVHEEAAAAAQQQLEIINQSMEKNQGWSKIENTVSKKGF